MPAHYEALESAVNNALYHRDTNPAENWFTREGNRFAPPGDPRFPFVLTTYRLTEHHTAGGMSRFLSHLAELQPEMFVEISPEAAVELGIKNGDCVCIVTLRGAIEARALVSRRMRPLHLNGKTVHQVAIPFHWGSAGPIRGDVANDLLAISGEPNVTIMETKALVCNMVPGRLPRGAAFLPWLNRYAPQTGPETCIPNSLRPIGTAHPFRDRMNQENRKAGKAKMWEGPLCPDCQCARRTHRRAKAAPTLPNCRSFSCVPAFLIQIFS